MDMSEQHRKQKWQVFLDKDFYRKRGQKIYYVK